MRKQGSEKMYKFGSRGRGYFCEGELSVTQAKGPPGVVDFTVRDERENIWAGVGQSIASSRKGHNII